MLDALRKSAGSWVAKLFIALLILSFAVWGISGFLTGVGQNTVAKVGNSEVSLFDFDRTYRQDLNTLSQQFGRQLTLAEGASIGVPQQTLGKLVAEAAMNSTAQDLKLGISNEELGTIIQSDPAFRGLSGRYDRNRLQQVLQSNGYTEDEYVLQRRKVAERTQIAEGITGAMQVPTAYLEALAAYTGETRTADYLLVTPETVGDIADPSEDVLSTYFEEHKADFKAPEYREIKYISLTPDDILHPEEITDQEARDEYDRQSGDFFQPERRRLRQMTFQSEEDANKAAAEIAEGKTFGDLMTERNLTENDVSLGVMAKSDFLDEALADAAFSLEDGGTSGAIDGRFATAIVNVQEILPAAAKPFEDVKEEIKTDLARDQARGEILEVVDEVEDARAGGATLEEIGDRFSIDVDTSEAFDASGNGMDGSKVTLPDSDELVAGTFDSDIGIENDVLQTGNQGYLWYEVSKVTPTRDRPLDEVRSDVVAAWKAGELEKRLNDVAEDYLAKLQSGTPIADVAQTAGLDVQSAEGLKRNTPADVFGEEALAAVFSGPVGTRSATPTADGTGKLVLVVTGATVPEFDPSSEEVTAMETQLSQQMQDSILGQFITDRENKAGVEINQAAVSQVIGLNQN
ncbi:peptidylprolyl isomerase [Rhodobacterales bacterium]|nr:peptidylprolyl isomerase [Rhodobacterales bacterium]